MIYLRLIVKNILLYIVFLSLLITSASYGYEERKEDLFASVVVTTTFKLSVDNSAMDFGFIKPGESYELYPTRYYNEAACISNTGRSWYLKMSLENDLRGVKNNGIIPKKNIKWSVDSFDGTGIRQEGWNSFEDIPVLIYTASPDDSKGEPVKIRLRYKLDVPGNVQADSYQTTILYSMTETP